MSKDDGHSHEVTLQHILAICNMALLVDAEALSGLLNQFNSEEAIGPILDPTGHMKVMGKMYNAHEASDAFADFYRRLQWIARAEQERITERQ